jgi:hypothetical protein
MSRLFYGLVPLLLYLAPLCVWRLCWWPVWASLVLGCGVGGCYFSLFLVICAPVRLVPPLLCRCCVPFFGAYVNGSALFQACTSPFPACFPTYLFLPFVTSSLCHTCVLPSHNYCNKSDEESYTLSNLCNKMASPELNE